MKEPKRPKGSGPAAASRHAKRTIAKKKSSKVCVDSDDITPQGKRSPESCDVVPAVPCSEIKELSPVLEGKKRKGTKTSQTESKVTPSTDTPASTDAVSNAEQQMSSIDSHGAETVVYRCDGILDSSQSFKDFGALHLDRRLTKVLIDVLLLEHPTHVQAQVVPLALGGRDLVVEGKTGSGKTLAYVLPLLQGLLRLHAQQQTTDGGRLPPLSGIILVPTKELCIQVYEVLTTMLKYTNDLVTVSHTANLQGSAGGPSGGPLFAPPTVMVATPTGMLQYLDQLRRQERRMDLQLSLQVLIVDEADLLFAFGFEKDTRRLLQLLPSTASRHYQTILVSATQNQELSQLQSLMLHKPLVVRIEEKEGTHGGPGAPGSIGEFYFQVPTEAEKWLVAYAFLRLGLVPLKCLVFCKDVANVYALRLFLDRFGIASGVLSPTLPMAAREQQIQAFNQGLIDILITSDGQDEEADDEFEAAGGSESAKACGSTATGQHKQSNSKRWRETASKLQDVECFRYRIEDVRRGLTKRVVAAAVARDLQQQLLNSGKLKEFFERNPRDREVLKRACKQLKEINVSKGHLGHLPDYLLSQTQPTQMTAVQLAIQQQKVAMGGSKGSQGGSRRRAAADPLKSFKAAVARGASVGKRKRAKRPPITRSGQLAKMPRHANEVPPEALPATSGRKLWKLRHNKRVGVKDPKGNFLRKRSIKGLRKK